MPVTKKIVLHPLERLDLVDVNGLQDLLFKNVGDAVGAISGGVAGLTRMWEAISINNSTDLISFADFQFQGGILQSDTQQLWSTYLGIFDASSDTNGTCSFDSVKTLVQNYVNANSALPPNPLDPAFVSGTHNQYYPYIYARSVYGDSVQANRRFWSVADAQENTQLVNTRVVEGVNFHVGTASDLPVVSGNQWVVIGRIYSWVNTAGTVTLASTGIQPYMLADALLNNNTADSWTKVVDADTNIDSDFNFRYAGGTAIALRYLKAMLDQVINEGANDGAGTSAFQTEVYEKPYYSLAGLAKQLTDVKSASTEYQGNVFFKWDYRTSYLVLPASNRLRLYYTGSSSDVTVKVDYTASTAGYPTFGIGAKSAPYYPASDNIYSSNQIRLILSNFVVLLPADAEGKKFTLTVNPVTDVAGMMIQGDLASATVAQTINQRASTMDILIDDATNTEDLSSANTVKALTYTDTDGTVQNGYGFKLRKSNWLSSPEFIATEGRYFTAFNFNLKILN